MQTDTRTPDVAAPAHQRAAQRPRNRETVRHPAQVTSRSHQQQVSSLAEACSDGGTHTWDVDAPRRVGRQIRFDVSNTSNRLLRQSSAADPRKGEKTQTSRRIGLLRNMLRVRHTSMSPSTAEPHRTETSVIYKNTTPLSTRPRST